MRHTVKAFTLFARTNAIGLILMFVFSLLISAIPLFNDGADAKVSVGLLDEDRSADSRSLIKNASNDSLFSIREFNPSERNSALNLLKSGTLEAVFVIPAGYSKKLESGEYRQTITAYYSPYSASVKTLSDAFGVLVLRDFLRVSVTLRVKKLAPQITEDEIKSVYAATPQADILSIQTDSGFSAAPQKCAQPLPLSFYILGVIAAFYMLCAVTPPRNMPGLFERMTLFGISPAAFTYAYTGVFALPLLGCAIVLSVYYAVVASFASALIALAAFLIYLACLAAVWMPASLLPLSAPARICLLAAFCLLNTVLAYPSGILSAFSYVKFLFPTALFSGIFSSPLYLIGLALYAAAFIALGVSMQRRIAHKL